MPAGRDLAADLASTLVELYAQAERDVATEVARRLLAGMDRPDWLDQKLGAVNDLRNVLQRVMSKLGTDARGQAAQTLVLAFRRGGGAALAELARLGGLDATQLAALRKALPGAEALNAMAFSLSSSLQGTHARVIRWALDGYRDVVTAATAGVLLGTHTRLQAAQRAWDRLLARGVTGFTDTAGRKWELASYVEMATRTASAQAAVTGHLDRLGAAGIDLVMASDSPQECALCRPWEGKVLSRTVGGARVQRETNPLTDDPVLVGVAGSVAEAIGAGFLHPNCRHSISAYLPGVTQVPVGTADPEGDQARQKLRGLERRVRAEKLREVAALDPVAARVHRERVRALQAQIRQHLETAPAILFRRPERERIGTAR